MPRNINEIIGLTTSSIITISSSKPYTYSAGRCDIPYTIGNSAIIAFVLVFEGSEKPTVTADELEAARRTATAENATDEMRSDYNEKKTLYHISDNWEAYANQFIILVACHQCKPLSTANIDNFCQMTGHSPMPAKIISYLSYFASKLPDILKNADADTLAQFAEHKFFEYHTTASSTPHLCHRALSLHNDVSMFDENELSAINESYENRDDITYSRRLNDFTLVKTRAILEANGILPETWYMGQKALDNYPIRRYNAIVKLIKRLITLELNLEGIDEMVREKVVERIEMFTKAEEDEDDDDDGEGGDDDEKEGVATSSSVPI